MRDPDRPRLPDPRMIPAARSTGWFDPVAPRPDRAVYPDGETAESFVRPFVVTAGRTAPLVDGLRIETLVQASPAALSAPLRFEERTVVALCQVAYSIAEIATALRVPIGVARVVVGDLATQGYVRVRDAPDLSIAAIERIRDLVRAL
ncbi:DUF742 domain-containing protein [Nocardia arizonensis]|uniref:DUF742 domain-containing protein n=1 Tax=Nocardia arizonensis TaxID=1141647 RepID=UPI0006D0DB9B|nr:DUF742 domain-containing protein [Nocardia arizonensis]